VNIVVIGCGPAGLAAAHAATAFAPMGATVRIIAPREKTPQHGPLLLQRPIPGINTDHPDGTIHQIVVGGSILDYRYRLYGDINIGINGDILRPHYFAWRHGPTYDRLWELYSGIIEDREVTPSELYALQYDPDVALVVSTAPARALCRNIQHHSFGFKQVAVTPEASYPDQPDNTLIFNAGEQWAWVRSSRVFGVPVTEWKVEDAPRGARIIRKPISTDCDCYPKVLRTGRFGAWKNEVWIDTAYWDVYGMLASMTRAPELEAIR
jgi:hypothetical protein